MAHILSSEALKPGFENKPVVTETGKAYTGNHTMEDILFALKLLAYNNTNYNKTSADLVKLYKISVHSSTLRAWATQLFTQKYIEIQHDLEQEINKKLGSQMIDLAAKSIEAQDKALDVTLDKIPRLDDAVSASVVARNVSTTTKNNVEQAALIEQKPTSIIEHRTPDENLKWLRERGLLQDAEVIEEEDE